MSDRLDLFSPSFIAGFVGMAITGDVRGFVIAAGVAWLAMFALLFVAAVLAGLRNDAKQSGSAAAQ